MGHWRWCTWIGFTHLLILAGGTPDFQQPYIAAPDTAHVDRSVTLSCYSVCKYNLVKASINWRKNGLPLDESSEYNIRQHHHQWPSWPGIYLYRSTLNVSDVNTAKGDNFTCQVVIGRRAVSGWSEAYVLVKQSGSYENYTVVREGHSCLITLKMPLDKYFKVMGPGNKRLFKVNTRRVRSKWVYIWNSYRTRVNITKITRSVDAVILQFSLHNATSEDTGRYHCSTRSDDPIPNCQHMLYVQADVTSSTVTVTSTQTSAATTTGVPLSTATTANTNQNVTTVVLYIMVGCCVLLIVLAVFIVAAIVLIRIKQQGVHQRRTPSTSTTSNIVQRQRYDVVECSPVGGAENSQLYAENSLGYHTLNFKRFNQVNVVDPTDANTTRNGLVPLDQDYEPVILMDHGPVLDCTQQYSDHEEENNDSVSLCSLYDNGQREKDRSGYAQCIVVAGNVPTMSIE